MRDLTQKHSGRVQMGRGLSDNPAPIDGTGLRAYYCDVQALAGLVTDDFEMYHDKGGLVATSGAQFVESIRGMCERQKTGEDYRARRELVEGSLEVYPLNNYGAVEVGVHRFYKKTEGQPDKLVEIAKFTQVWKKDANGWKLARVLSYDHKLTE